MHACFLGLTFRVVLSKLQKRASDYGFTWGLITWASQPYNLHIVIIFPGKMLLCYDLTYHSALYHSIIVFIIYVADCTFQLEKRACQNECTWGLITWHSLTFTPCHYLSWQEE